MAISNAGSTGAGKSITKGSFVDKLALEAEMTKKDATAFLNAFISVVQDSLKKGNNINITGFGKFYVVHRKKRNGRNPRTGDRITIKARKIPAFKPGRKFKEAI